MSDEKHLHSEFYYREKQETPEERLKQAEIRRIRKRKVSSGILIFVIKSVI